MTASPWPGDLLDIMDWSSAEEEDIDQAGRDVVTPAIYSQVFLPECGHFYANTFVVLCIDINSGAAARDQDLCHEYFGIIQHQAIPKNRQTWQNLCKCGGHERAGTRAKTAFDADYDCVRGAWDISRVQCL